MHRLSLALSLLALAATASADTLTVTVSGTGSGSWGSQAFSNAAFTMIFTSDTNNVSQGTPCCSAIYTTPAGTPATVNVAGFGAANLTDNQAVFVNQQESTAGIWHYDSPDFLDVGAAPFSTWNLNSSIGPVSGTTFSFATPFSMNPGGSIYFSSVSGVTFTAQRASGNGQPSIVSFSPNGGNAGKGDSTLMTFVVSDTAGASDLQGFDILFSGSAGPWHVSRSVCVLDVVSGLH